MRERAAVLSRETILELLEQDPPLVEGLQSVGDQIQPCGVDLTVRSVYRFDGSGALGAASQDRRLAPVEEIEFGPEGYLHLEPGTYQIMYAEVVNIPQDLMALGLPRSSLLRCGVSIHTAVWDAGYRGRSVSLLVVYNPSGFRLQKGARVLQLVFMSLSQPAREGYAGAYKNENL